MSALVEQLNGANGLPRQAIDDCLANIEAVAPELLALVEQAADGTLDPAQLAPLFYGVHILAAARQQRLFAPLMRLLRRPTQAVEALLGEADIVTLPRIIAGGFDGNAAELFELIRRPATDPYMRDSLFGAVAFLTWAGRIDADATRGFIERYDDERLVPDDDFAWFAWSHVIELLGLSDLTPRVERAYADGRIPREISDLRRFRAGMADALAAEPGDASRFVDDELGYLDDLGEELATFDFGADKPVGRDGGGVAPGRDAPPAFLTPEQQEQYRRGMPVTRSSPKIGRNDPCPCGSGKKYKRCCGAVAA